MILFSEVVADVAVAALFPVNALLNAALLAARTPMVMLGDADLLVSSSLNAALSNTAGWGHGPPAWIVHNESCEALCGCSATHNPVIDQGGSARERTKWRVDLVTLLCRRRIDSIAAGSEVSS